MAQILKTIKKRIQNKNKLSKMKKQVVFLSAIMLSMAVFGQKNELKTAEKAIKSNDFKSAITAINSAEGLIANADNKLKAKFYYLKGKALYQNGAGQFDVEKAGNAFNELLRFEESIKSYKYSNEIGELINSLVSNVASKASNQYNVAIQTKTPEDYNKAAKSFYQVFALSPKDTSFLDNAALVYYYGKSYDKSIAAYEKLLDLNYTGISTVYKATDKSTGKDVVYGDEKAMNLQVKLGLAENPRTEQKDSRRDIIFKNLAQNYGAKDNLEKALEYIAKGREEFPSSYNLLIEEANIYYKKGDNDMFKTRLEEAIKLNPTEPSLYYNVGVMNMDQGNLDEAISYFEKAVELKPDYADAHNNIGAAYIEKANPIIEEMNKSLTDFDKYDRLQAQQLEIYKQAIPHYEMAYKYNPESISTVQTLLGLYENLEMTDKYNELKAVHDSMK